MWIYNIWDQFEKLKAIHLNTKWYLMQSYKNKKFIHNIVFIYWDISNMSDLFFKFFLEPKINYEWNY